MEIRVGDRFKFNGKDSSCGTWETISPYREGGWSCLKLEDGRKQAWMGLDRPPWIYLGNFSKGDNFTNLYDILNNPSNLDAQPETEGC